MTKRGLGLRAERDERLARYETPAGAAATVSARQERIVWHLGQVIELVRQNEVDIDRWRQSAQECAGYPQQLRR